VLGFLGEQRFAIFPRNLVIVGMDFGKGEKSVAVATIVDKSGLQRRFDAGTFAR